MSRLLIVAGGQSIHPSRDDSLFERPEAKDRRARIQQGPHATDRNDRKAAPWRRQEEGLFWVQEEGLGALGGRHGDGAPLGALQGRRGEQRHQRHRHGQGGAPGGAVPVEGAADDTSVRRLEGSQPRRSLCTDIDTG